MPRRRSTPRPFSVFVAIVSLIVVVIPTLLAMVGAALTWVAITWRSLSLMGQVLTIALLIIATICAVAFVIAFGWYLVDVFRKWQAQREHERQQRILVWQRMMNEWTQENRLPFANVRSLDHKGLERFAAQVFNKIGYQARVQGGAGDQGADVMMTNPKGQVEIVQCKQYTDKKVDSPEMQKFVGAMTHFNAVRGFYFAPNGFTQPARDFAKGKPIHLCDENEIGALVTTAYRG